MFNKDGLGLNLALKHESDKILLEKGEHAFYHHLILNEYIQDESNNEDEFLFDNQQEEDKNDIFYGYNEANLNMSIDT